MKQNNFENSDSELTPKINVEKFTNLTILKDDKDSFSFSLKPKFESFWFSYLVTIFLFLPFMLYLLSMESKAPNNSNYIVISLCGFLVCSIIIFYYSRGANIFINKSTIKIDYKWILNLSLRNSVTIDINNNYRSSRQNLEAKIQEMAPFFRRQAENKNIFRINLSSFDIKNANCFSEVVKYLTREEAEYIVYKIEKIIKE